MNKIKARRNSQIGIDSYETIKEYSGTSLTLENCLNRKPLSFNIEGRCEQITTVSNNNILDLSKLTIINNNLNGFVLNSILPNEISYSISGTNNCWVNFRYKLNIKENSNYTLTCKVFEDCGTNIDSYGRQYGYWGIYRYDKGTSNNLYKIEDGNIGKLKIMYFINFYANIDLYDYYLLFWPTAATTFTGTSTFHYEKIGLIKGHISSDDSYIPFIPDSPSIEYNSDIYNITNIGCKVKPLNVVNFIPHITQFNRDGFSICVDNLDYIHVSGTPSKNYASIFNGYNLEGILENGKTYTLWREKHANSERKTGIYNQINMKNKVTGVQSYPNTAFRNQVFTTDFDTYSYYYILQSGTTNECGTLNDYTNRFMILEGDYTNKKVTYSPYFEPQTISNLLETNGFRGSLPNGVKDGITTKRVGKKVFDGTENFYIHSSVLEGTTRFSIDITDIYNSKSNTDNNVYVISNYFRGVTFSKLYSDVSIGSNLISNYNDITINNRRFYFRIDSYIASTIEQFKQFFANKYAEGDPVIVYYQLAEPYEVQLPTESQTFLNNLTLNEGTNIVSNSENSNMNIKYLATQHK